MPGHLLSPAAFSITPSPIYNDLQNDCSRETMVGNQCSGWCARQVKNMMKKKALKDCSTCIFQARKLIMVQYSYGAIPSFAFIAVRFSLECHVQWSVQHEQLSAAVIYTSGIVPRTSWCLNYILDARTGLVSASAHLRVLCQVDTVKHCPNRLWHEMWHVLTRTCKNDRLWGCGRLILPIPGIASRQSPWKCSTSLSSRSALTSPENSKTW